MQNPSGQERLTYFVTLDPGLQRISVRVCPIGFRLARLAAPSPEAQALLADNRFSSDAKRYAGFGDGVDLDDTRVGECVAYGVRLPERMRDAISFQRVGQDLLISPDLWLWEPLPRPDAPLRLHLDLPAGVQPALPWSPISPVPPSGVAGDASPGFEFLVPNSAFAWRSAGAFVRTAPSQLAVPGADVRFFGLGAGFGSHDAALRAWLEAGARASATLYGPFPVRRALVLAVPRERKGPSFGMALRGGGPALVLLVDRAADAAALVTDWTATHEFLHLGVPRLPPEDAWLFEGLATYYAEVTRARAGIIGPERAVQRLLDGFQRGRSQASELTLREASAQMRERHEYVRVYWAGAALALMTDVAARRAGGPSLDDALRAFAACCADTEREWNAERMLARVDQSLGAPQFAPVARRWLDRRDFPELEPLLGELGVSVGANADARFAPAPDSKLRDAIFAPSPRAPSEEAQGGHQPRRSENQSPPRSTAKTPKTSPGLLKK